MATQMTVTPRKHDPKPKHVAVPDQSEQIKVAPGGHTPTYRPPSRGVLSLLPASWVPYGELMRLHKPAGYFAFYFPHLTGFLLAQAALPAQSLSWEQHLVVHLCLLTGTLFLRGAACSWNDTLDAPYDRKVARCRQRPIARNAVSRAAGTVFTFAQAILGILVGLVPLPRTCWAPAVLLTASQAVYPMFKRFTNYPQLWLGFSFGFGLAVGSGAAGVDHAETLSRIGRMVGAATVEAEKLIRDTTATQGSLFEALGSIVEAATAALGSPDGRLLSAMTFLYAAGVLNTVIYDTIYGHQDLQDDLKAGVKSMAVAWKDKTKRNCAALAVAEIGLLAAAGFVVRLGPAFYLVTVGGTALVLTTLLYRVRLNDPASCMRCFNWLIGGTGVALALGLITDRMM